MKALLLVVLGLACLVFGAEWFVSGSARLSRRLGVPSLLVGLTIVAFGTSMPEFAVSFTASLQEANEIAVGNVIGSNIFNLLFILGLCAVIKPVPIARSAGLFDVPISLLAAAIVMAFTALAGCANWPWATIALPRWSGILLLVLFVLITGYQIRRSLREGTQKEGESAFGNHNVPLWRLIGLIAGGLAVIVIGGKLTVSGAVDLAKAVGAPRCRSSSPPWWRRAMAKMTSPSATWSAPTSSTSSSSSGFPPSPARFRSRRVRWPTASCCASQPFSSSSPPSGVCFAAPAASS